MKRIRSSGKQGLNIDVTTACKKLIVELSKRGGVSQAAVVERAVRELAEREYLSDAVKRMVAWMDANGVSADDMKQAALLSKQGRENPVSDQVTYLVESGKK